MAWFKDLSMFICMLQELTDPRSQGVMPMQFHNVVPALFHNVSAAFHTSPSPHMHENR